MTWRRGVGVGRWAAAVGSTSGQPCARAGRARRRGAARRSKGRKQQGGAGSRGRAARARLDGSPAALPQQDVLGLQVAVHDVEAAAGGRGTGWGGVQDPEPADCPPLHTRAHAQHTTAPHLPRKRSVTSTCCATRRTTARLLPCGGAPVPRGARAQRSVAGFACRTAARQPPPPPPQGPCIGARAQGRAAMPAAWHCLPRPPPLAHPLSPHPPGSRRP